MYAIGSRLLDARRRKLAMYKLDADDPVVRGRARGDVVVDWHGVVPRIAFSVDHGPWIDVDDRVLADRALAVRVSLRADDATPTMATRVPALAPR